MDMKRVYGIMLLCSLLSVGMELQAQSYESLWKQVEQAQKQDLPKSVVRIAEQIAEKAEQEKNVPQLWKAQLCRNAYTEHITPDSLQPNLRRWELWAERETNPCHAAVLHSIVAGACTDGSRIEKHVQASLQPEEMLLNSASTEYQPVVEPGEQSRYYGHDLYHLLARRALECYGRLGRERGQMATDSLYRRMEAIYTQREGEEDAALWTALEAWKWRQQRRHHEEQQEALEALDTLMNRYGERELCAEVWLAKAEWIANHIQEKNEEENGCDKQKALALCDEALRRYPHYRRVAAIRNLRARLLQPELQLLLPTDAYPGDTLKGMVHMANLEGVTLHIYRTAYSEWPVHGKGQLLQADQLRRGARVASRRIEALCPKEQTPYPLTARQTVHWTMQTPEFPGVYVVEAVPDRPTRNGKYSYSVLTVSRLAMLAIELPGQQVEVAVVDGRSGHPIAGASVTFYPESERSAGSVIAEGETGADGRVILPTKGSEVWAKVRVNGDTAYLGQYVSSSPLRSHHAEQRVNRLTLLTDRSLYRPGQTVFVKGIAYEQDSRQAEVLTGKRYTLRLLSANRQEIATQEVTTGEFGSFSHSFILPTTGLNGQYLIEVKEMGSTTTIRVEAYKRPTFELKLLPVSEAYRIGDTVRVRGVAMAYHGTAVQQAKVMARLTLQPRFHDFRRKWEEIPLRNDTVEVDATGNFCLMCPLTLPKGEKLTSSPWIYQLEAVVIDEAGEAHTVTHTWEAREKAYRFDPQLPDLLLKEEELSARCFRVSNQEQVAQSPAAHYRLYRLSPQEECVLEAPFVPNQTTDCTKWGELPSGAYRLQLIVTDSLGRKEESDPYPFTLMSKQDTRPALFTPFFVREETLEFDTDHPARFDIGTSLQEVYLMWTEVDAQGATRHGSCYLTDTLVHWEVPYQESYGQGTTWSFAFVKNGVSYTRCITLKRKQPERKLNWRWETFRDQLTPGGVEEWKLVLTDEHGVPAAAELLATLYDASLEQIYNRPQRLHPFFTIYLHPSPWKVGWRGHANLYLDFARRWWKEPDIRFDKLVSYELPRRIAGGQVRQLYKVMASTALTKSSNMMQADNLASIALDEETTAAVEEDAATSSEIPATEWRTDFAETAFFYPHLQTDSLGQTVVAFQIPQSLTRWNFRGYAHTRQMQTANLEASVVTAKEWMLTPHLPRFVRAGDRTQLSATIANQTPHPVNGVATLTLFDPINNKNMQTQRVKFTCQGSASCVVRFNLQCTGKQDLVGIRIVAEGEGFSDGEQHLLPVLSQSQWITETLPLPIRGKESRTFSLDSLFNHQSSKATDRRLTIEFTGNPAWLAVQALPALSQPDEKADALSWAAAYYAGQLAAHIAHSQPRIQALLKAWQFKGNEETRLLHNEELKEILLEETPWVSESQHEAERQAKLMALFDLNQVNLHGQKALDKLKALQGSDGSWSWFPGMKGNLYVTAYVTELLLRLPKLTGQPLTGDALRMKQKSMAYLQKEVDEVCRRMRHSATKQKLLPSVAREFLYLAALENDALNSANYTYLVDLLEKEQSMASMHEKAQGAYILWQSGRKQAANRLLASLREHLVQEKEIGTHFAFLDYPYTWGMLPIPTHVRAMEVLRLTGEDNTLIEEMKQWLLKQKQTRAWNTTTATADAIYALLCQGRNLLADQGDVTLTLNKHQLHTADSTVPGLNYLLASYSADDPACKTRQIQVEKHDEGLAWGAVYAQYRIPMGDILEQSGELSVVKQYYVERMDGKGNRILQAVENGTPLQIGDKVVVRFTLKLDRAMDFLQLKDGQAACLEPIGSLSGYRWSRNLGYYMDRKDASTHFFLDHLGKGMHVLEYTCRVARAGSYQSGVATLQSAYAPEFAAHSTAQILEVK